MATAYQNNLARLYELQKFGIKLGLSSTENLMKRLGRPDQGRFAHLAGTNGKGSVASIMALALQKAGYKVGLYTSPHLITFRERISINGVMISEEEVVDYANRIWAVCDAGEPPTFFEFVTALAFLYFKDAGVDWAMIEAGLGGRLDATNLIDPALSIITNISLEHTEYLGDTAEKIAWEKAGIIKPGRPTVVGMSPPEALKVILDMAREKHSPAWVYGRDFKIKPLGEQTFDYQGLELSLPGLRPSLWGPHQRDNAALALAALELLRRLKSASRLERAHLEAAVQEVNWPGRAESRPPGSWPPESSPLAFKGRAPLLLDGAHNPAGAEALALALKDHKHAKLHLILGVMADKDLGGILGPLLPLADCLYLTRPEYDRAAAPEVLRAGIVSVCGPPEAETGLYAHIPEALEAAALKAGPEDLVLVSGSLFTVGEARAYLEGVAETELN